MIAVGVILVAGIIALIFVKSPKIKRSPARALASIAVLGVTLSAATTFSVSSGSLATTFHNIQDAYKDYGFAYCFACSVVDRGISKPEDYSRESIQSVVDGDQSGRRQCGSGKIGESDGRDAEYRIPSDGVFL